MKFQIVFEDLRIFEPIRLKNFININKMSLPVISVEELSKILQTNTPMYASIILNNLSITEEYNYLVFEVIKVINEELNSYLLQNERQRTISSIQNANVQQKTTFQKSAHWVRAPENSSEMAWASMDGFNNEKGDPTEGKVIIMNQSTFDRWAALNRVNS
jgi:hypothetical protein